MIDQEKERRRGQPGDPEPRALAPVLPVGNFFSFIFGKLADEDKLRRRRLRGSFLLSLSDHFFFKE